MPSKNILLAEDNSDDALIFRMMFRRAALPHKLFTVEDGQQAIDWLSGAGAYVDREQFPLPEMLILDLKMPIKSGFDVLEWVRSETKLQDMSVIILSSSDDARDLKRANQLGVATYFVKSPQLADVIQFLRSSA